MMPKINRIKITSGSWGAGGGPRAVFADADAPATRKAHMRSMNELAIENILGEQLHFPQSVL